MTHTAPFDRFGEHTDAQKVACSSTFLSPGKAQEAVACQQHKRILFVPMAVSSKGEAARLDKTPRKWDGELPLQLTDRHRSPAVLPLSLYFDGPFHRSLTLGSFAEMLTHSQAYLRKCLTS